MINTSSNRGFFGAYHMNKTNWISVALDGSADDEKVKMLVDLSFEIKRNDSITHNHIIMYFFIV